VKRASFWGVVTCLAVLIIVIAVWPVAFWHRFYGDFWGGVGFDRSVIGPNLVASLVQWFVIALVAVLVYPPLRAMANREWNHLHAKLDHNADVLHHIVHHSRAIPNVDHEGVEWAAKRPSRGRPL
jgi:hypothetical protein